MLTIPLLAIGTVFCASVVFAIVDWFWNRMKTK
jgi:hypothetical protein